LVVCRERNPKPSVSYGLYRFIRRVSKKKFDLNLLNLSEGAEYKIILTQNLDLAKVFYAAFLSIFNPIFFLFVRSERFFHLKLL